MSINVGTVYVPVRPDLREWPRRLRQELEPIARQIGEEVGKALGRPITDEASDAAAQGVRRGGPRATRAARDGGEDAGGAFARQFRTRVQAAMTALPKAEVDAETSPADAAIEGVRRRLAMLQDRDIGVDLDADMARQELAAMARRLQELQTSDPRLRVRVNTGAAAAELAAFERQLQGLEGQTVQVGVTTDRISREISKAVEAAARNLPEVQVDADADLAQVELDRLRRRLLALQDRRIGVDIAADDARAELDAIAAQLAELSGSGSTAAEVRINAGGALADLEALQRRLQQLDRSRATAEVDIRQEPKPDRFGRELGKAIDAAVANLPELEITADSSPAEREVAGLRAALFALRDERIGLDIDAETAQARLDDISARLEAISQSRDTDIELRVDTGGAVAELAGLQRTIDRLDHSTVTIEAEVEQDRFSRELTKAIDAAARNLPELEITADSTQADRQVADLRSRLLALQGQRVGIDIAAEDARSEIAAISQELRRLSRGRRNDINVRVNTGGALSELESLEQVVDRLDRRTIDVHPSGRGTQAVRSARAQWLLLLEAAIAFAPAIVPAIATVAAGVAGLVAVLGTAAGLLGIFGAAAIGTGLAAHTAADEIQQLREQIAATTDVAARAELFAELDQALADLSPRMRAFLGALDSLSGAWDSFVSATEPTVLRALSTAIGTLQAGLAPLAGVVQRLGPAFQAWFDRIDAWVHGPGYQAFIGFLVAEGPRALQNLTRLMAGLVSAIGGVVRAFAPFGQDLLAGMADGMERLATQAQRMASTQAFQGFLSYVREQGPQVLAVLSGLWDALVAIGQALAPLAGPFLGALRALLSVLESMAETAPGLVQLSVVLFAIVRGIDLFSRGSRKLQGQMDRLRIVSGNVATAAGGMRARMGTLFSAMGGPWSLAIGGLVTGFGLLASAHAKAEAQAEELKQTLDETTGALTGRTREVVAARLAEEGAVDAADRLGVGLGVVSEAALNGGDAMERLRRRVHRAMLAQGGYNDEQTKMDATALINQVANINREIGKQQRVIEDTNRAQGGYIERSSGLRFATKEEAREHARAGRSIRDRHRELRALVEQMQRTRAQSLAMRNAQIGYQQALDDVTRSVRENGRTHNINTQRGRDNEQSLLRLAEAQNKLAEDTSFGNRPIAQQNRILRRQRREFIDAATSMGYTREEARKLAAQYLRTPKEVRTESKLETQEKKLNQWKKGLADVPDEENTDLKANPIRRGIARFLGHLAALPHQRITQLRALAQRSGIDTFWGWLSAIPDSITTTIRGVFGGFSLGGIVPGFAAGGTVPAADLRHGGTLPGYSRRDDTLALLRRGEGILVPEVVKWLGPRRIREWNAIANRGGTPSFANGGVLPARSAATYQRPATVQPNRSLPPQSTKLAAPNIRVYIGDQELRGLVRVEVNEHDRQVRRRVRTLPTY